MNITVSLKVEGEETMDVNFSFKNTNIKTVMAIEQAILGAFSGLLSQQAQKENV